MPLKFGSTTVTNVMFEQMSNGASSITLDKIIYNGTTVFERQKTLKTITEKLSYTYYYTSYSSGASFRYPSASLQLSYTPVKVTKLGVGLPGSGSVVISSTGLSGTMRAYGTTGQSSSYIDLSWNVSGSKFNISSGGSSSGSTKTNGEISVTYQYYG